MKIYRYIKYFLTPALFLIVIYFAMIDKMFSFTKDIQSSENRKLKARPKLDFGSLDNFPMKYEEYFNDNFPLRNYLISQYNYATINYLKKSPVPGLVLFGKKDWLFYGEKHIKVYRGIEHYSKNELNDIKNELLYRYEYLKKRGIKYYFVILPTKYTVYPEYVADNITKLYNKTITDQLIEAFDGKAPFRLIDTRQAVIDGKKSGIRLFQKTDAHWNSAGAFFAYKLISENLKKDFPDDVQTRKFEDYSVDSVWEKGGDLTKMLGTFDISKENQIYLKERFKSLVFRGKEMNYDPKGFAAKDDYEIVCINPKNKKLKGLIIRDSYTGFMVQYLQEDFYKSTYIFDRWEYGLEEEIVEKEKPDVFINIVVECHLRNLLEHLSYKKARQ
jgi:alginate O-acetyltransferase complex protein AlgJ